MVYVAIAVVVLFACVVLMYNTIIRKDTLSTEALHGIDVQLKRRYDLIPSLVEVVKGYVKHEKSTLEDIVKLRNMSQNLSSVDEKSKVEGQLSGALKSIFALAEGYPDLKSNENFMQLHSSLAEIEDNIQMARKYYNATVREYNVFIKIFPMNLLANKFGFKEKQFFSIENSEERNNVEVKF